MVLDFREVLIRRLVKWDNKSHKRNQEGRGSEGRSVALT
jgi:hypothetical protein